MSQLYNFIDIFDNELDLNKNTKVKVSKLVIPKIQRPYAQGRKDAVCTYVRNTLLDELFANFKTDRIFDFNFIYGIVRPMDDSYVMELLDGQQRLTTLFLLYWYITNRELPEGDEQGTLIRTALHRFDYQTRATSSIFCHRLADYYIDLSSSTPSETIRQARWYFKSFDRDSTICAMLTMLDAIHERYNAQSDHELYKKLGNIRFYIKSLGYFNLSEELYIKMNARGLQLSPFENFKADLTNFINNSDYAQFDAQTPLYKKGDNEVVPFRFNFSVKLDAKWIDIFWKRGSEDFDSAYMSFFTRYFACKYIVATKGRVSDLEMRRDMTIDKLYTQAEKRNDSYEYLGFSEFEGILKEHPEYIQNLDKVLDVFYNEELKNVEKPIFHALVPAWDKKSDDDGDDFYCNLSSKMTLTKLILFGAIISFIEAYDTFDAQLFNRWMRVVWNIVENTNIDSLTPASALIRKLTAIAYSLGRKSSEGVPFFTALSQWKDENEEQKENRAVLEEVEKAGRIAEDADWLPLFEEAERHPFFKGMVLFFYTDGISLDDYKHRYQLAGNMFDANGIAPAYRKDHILIRAIVSRFTTWGELDHTYITERAENHKYLKNILAANDKVRAMLAETTQVAGQEEAITCLEHFIDNAPAFTPWNTENAERYLRLVVPRIRTDIKLYNWLSAEQANHPSFVFRLYWFKGHIMFAVPNRQYAKVALDTERAKIAYEISKKYDMLYADNNQRTMYELYGDSFGNDIWLQKEMPDYTVEVGFCLYHLLKVQVDCKLPDKALKIQAMFDGASFLEGSDHIVEIARLEHFDFQPAFDSLSAVLVKLFESN